MAHWHTNLPQQILDVQYEDMVHNLEKMSHKIIDFIGLDWDDKCLNFHVTSRQVKTASVEQVRKPIYTSSISSISSIGKWCKQVRRVSHLVVESSGK